MGEIKDVIKHRNDDYEARLTKLESEVAELVKYVEVLRRHIPQTYYSIEPQGCKPQNKYSIL